ncbi:hypothetical protein D3C87_1680840 [compost metagenome]
MGQITQQLLLQGHCALQAFGHVIEGSAQLTQLIGTVGGTARQPHAQLVGAPGIGLLAQTVQWHDQQSIQHDAQHQGEQARDDAVGDHPPEHPITPGHKALRQLDHQAADGRIAGKRHPQPRPAFFMDGPVQAAQKGQALDVLVR